MKNNLKIYGVKDAYIKYLSQYQEHLFLHEGGSFGRKYIGTVIEIDGLSYFAPLSSFKAKHKEMKECVDFIKTIESTLCEDSIVMNKRLCSYQH